MKAGGSGIHRRALQALLLALALAVALPALALGLGRIVVKSAPGQPLLAEIPVVAADPSELSNLQVRLASPETFRRVGLPAPDATTSNLQFTVALDDRGRPVIRVTSAAPMRQPLLAFLIEVDWGAGRLVREYSVLFDAPSSMAAPSQPIQAPTVAAPNIIPREPVPAPVEQAPAPAATAQPAPADETVETEPLPEAAPAPQPVAPAPEPVAAEPEPASIPVPAPAAPAQAPAAEAIAAPPTPEARTVRRGETLSGIAAGLDRGGRSLDQMMLALLQANPDAFIDGNINLVRAGAVLRAPSSDALERYSTGEASALVRQQVAQWRQAAAARLPANAAGPEGAAPQAVADAGREAGETRGQDANPQEPRLQIVPAASGKGAGTQSGMQAGGEGMMLQQQIQETRETIAARDAEVGELKTRIAELEKIQQQQQQLISLKDTALAEARSNLVKAQQQSAIQPVPAAKQQAAQDDALLWPWLLLALVLLLAGGWWWTRRRGGPRPPVFGAPRGSRPSPAGVVPVAAPIPAGKPAAPAPSFAATAAVAPAAPAPPTVPAPAGTAPQAASRTLSEENASPARQVELARAYLDLGDEAAARELLREATEGRDPIAREIATRMLRDLG